MSKNVILVVEDNSIEAMDIKKTLESSGYTVSEIVTTVEDALKNISKSKPDLILMDIVSVSYTHLTLPTNREV